MAGVIMCESRRSVRALGVLVAGMGVVGAGITIESE